jgi:two-component sensor histidine kinase
MPADYDWNDSHSLGLRLVKSLTKQLMGSVEMVQDGGTVYTIRVKPKNPFKRKEEHIQS